MKKPKRAARPETKILIVDDHPMMRQGLAQLEQIPQNIEEFSDVVESEREFYCWMLTLEAGIKTAEANLAWMESVIERIKNGEMPKS